SSSTSSTSTSRGTSIASERIDARELGRRGERRAAWFYRLRGYRIVARNVRSRDGEIDLVVRRGRMLVIAEVKARQSTAAGEGFDAVDRRTREQLQRSDGRPRATAIKSPDTRRRSSSPSCSARSAAR